MHGLVSCEQSRSKDVNDLSEVPIQQVGGTTKAVWCTKMTSVAADERYCFGMIQVTESGKRHAIFGGSTKPYDLDAATWQQ